MGGQGVLPILLLTCLRCVSSKLIKCPTGIESFSAYPSEEAPTPDFYFNCENQIAVLRKCSTGFVYQFLNEKCIKSSAEIPNIRQRGNPSLGRNQGINPRRNQNTLGRTVNLGNIYYAANDEIRWDENLWSEKILKSMSQKQQDETSETDTLITQDQLDRNNLLDIEANLALGFMGGLVQIGGSAKYLDDRRTQTNSVQVSLKFDATTETEWITADMKQDISYTEICNKVGTKNGPTHVVTSLKRGFRAIFTFVKETEDKTKNAEVGGQLSVAIKSLPNIQIEGDASVETKETDKINKESLRVKFWGTTILDEAVTTFDDAVKVYKELPEKAKKSKSVVSFGLSPINDYCDGKTAILNSISTNAVTQLTSVLNILENLQIEIESQILKPAAQSYLS